MWCENYNVLSGHFAVVTPDSMKLVKIFNNIFCLLISLLTAKVVFVIILLFTVKIETTSFFFDVGNKIQMKLA